MIHRAVALEHQQQLRGQQRQHPRQVHQQLPGSAAGQHFRQERDIRQQLFEAVHCRQLRQQCLEPLLVVLGGAFSGRKTIGFGDLPAPAALPGQQQPAQGAPGSDILRRITRKNRRHGTSQVTRSVLPQRQ